MAARVSDGATAQTADDWLAVICPYLRRSADGTLARRRRRAVTIAAAAIDPASRASRPDPAAALPDADARAAASGSSHAQRAARRCAGATDRPRTARGRTLRRPFAAACRSRSEPRARRGRVASRAGSAAAPPPACGWPGRLGRRRAARWRGCSRLATRGRRRRPRRRPRLPVPAADRRVRQPSTRLASAAPSAARPSPRHRAVVARREPSHGRRPTTAADPSPLPGQAR